MYYINNNRIKLTNDNHDSYVEEEENEDKFDEDEDEKVNCDCEKVLKVTLVIVN